MSDIYTGPGAALRSDGGINGPSCLKLNLCAQANVIKAFELSFIHFSESPSGKELPSVEAISPDLTFTAPWRSNMTPFTIGAFIGAKTGMHDGASFNIALTH
jgi:hypothetical protein